LLEGVEVGGVDGGVGGREEGCRAEREPEKQGVGEQHRQKQASTVRVERHASYLPAKIECEYMSGPAAVTGSVKRLHYVWRLPFLTQR